MAEIASVQTTFVRDRPDDRAGAYLVPLTDVDAICRHLLIRPAFRLRTGFGPLASALGRRRLRCHQKRLPVTAVQRESRRDVRHRHVVLAFVLLDEPAEEVDARRAERFGDRVAEPRDTL